MMRPWFALLFSSSLVVAGLAACSDGDSEPIPQGGAWSQPSGAAASAGGGAGADGGVQTKGASPGVNNGEAHAYFVATVHPSLLGTCGSCHGTAGPGPAWLLADANAAYTAMENMGYLAKQSRILSKGVHSGGLGPAVTSAQASLYSTWVEKELAARGDAAPTSIMEKLGGCFDKAKFDAIKLDELRVTARDEENQNNCTGCKQGTQCMTCHSSDPATGVILAFGNNNVPQDHTFAMAKTLPYMNVVLGTDGAKIVGSKKLALKSEATIKDKPYTHPMYLLPDGMQAKIDAFAADVAAKYKAGTCGK